MLHFRFKFRLDYSTASEGIRARGLRETDVARIRYMFDGILRPIVTPEEAPELRVVETISVADLIPKIPRR
ncbi:hypothetical protein IPO96_00955 [Candidatus Saccharibacteria bacterium]|nr:MAG: hypothetical protein IPO96_00955 [Candidatus Saccharibacteria bacterium]